jgi:ubiquinone/menaquinone biosynthesis C-methylase UbiE
MAELNQQSRQHYYSPIAQAGFIAPSLYDKYRPSYLGHAVQHLLSSLGVDAGNTRILELGAGTGKLTEKLAVYLANSTIVAIEPHAKMRDLLDQKQLPNVTVMDGLAQCIPLPDESVDYVLAAQVRQICSV